MEKKQFTQETFDKMIDKVVFWNELAGNLPEDKSLEPVYLQLAREEMFGQNEFLQGWFTSDKVMQADGLADSVFTSGFLAVLTESAENFIIPDEDYRDIYSVEEIIGEYSGTLINIYGYELLLENLYALCLKMSVYMDVEAVFNAVYESNMTKYVHEASLGDFDLEEEVGIIEEQNRYSGVDYHKVGSYYIFTAKQDVQSGVVFDKPKIVKPSTFKEPIDLTPFIY